MSKYIECNKLNKHLKYILFAAIFRYLNAILLGYNYIDSFEEISLLKFFKYILNSETEADLPNFRMIESFFNYIIVFICSLFCRIYELKITKRKLRYFFNYNGSFAITAKETFGIKRIVRISKTVKENILYKFKNYIINNSSFLIYVIISFIWISEEITWVIFIPLLKDIDFWFFEILIATIIYSKIFLVQIYRHHIFAILLNLIVPSLLKIICIALTLNTDEHIIYNYYPWWIPLGFIIDSLLTAIISFINCSLKSFLDLKFITISILLMFYSAVGVLVSFLICIISTYYPCCEKGNNGYLATMCKVKDETHKYLDSFILYFNSYSDDDTPGKVIRIFIIIFDGITYFFKQYFILLSIKFLDPVHICFYIPIYYVFEKVILVINTLIIDHEWINDSSNYRVAKYFLDMGGDFFCLLGSLIYFEIIHVNICDLSYNVKKNIAERSLSDKNIDLNDKYSDDDYYFDYDYNEDETGGRPSKNNEISIEMNNRISDASE